MKRISILCILMALGFSVLAQSFRKTNFTAPLKATVNAGDLNEPFYNPSLVHLDQHPVPYFSDFGDKKQAAQKKRAQSLRDRNPYQVSNKTLGAAANPIVDTGWLANTGGIPMDNDIAVSIGFSKLF